MDQLVTENAKLIGKPGAIREFYTVDRTTVEKVTEAEGKSLYKAKVFQCNKPLQNPRIYPKEVMEANVKRLRPILKDGYLSGSVDHASYFSAGNLGDTVIIWRNLEINDRGEGIGQFEVIEGHSKGKDFLAQVESGLAIGFSTYGYGSAHEPTDEERKKYKLSKHDCVVILDENYTLKKIDAVDDPSCEDARLMESKENENMDITNLEQLKSELPAVHAMHESAVNAVETQRAALEATNKTLLEAINAILPKLKAVEGIQIPDREVLPAETQSRIEGLQNDLKAANAATEAAKAVALQAQNKVAAFEAEKLDAKRKADAAAKLTEALADEKFKSVRDAIVAAALLDDKSFTAESVAKFIEGKMAEYAKLAKPTKAAEGTTGKDVTEGQVAAQDEKNTPAGENKDRGALNAYRDGRKAKQ